jgi:proton glutamate symport protein
MTVGPLPGRRFGSASLTTWSVAAMVLALAIGSLDRSFGTPALAILMRVVRPLGAWWLTALRVSVLPLVVTQILAAIASGRDGRTVASLGLRSLVLFLVMLGAGALLTCVVTPPLLALYHVDPAIVASLRATTVVPEVARRAARAAQPLGALSALGPRQLIEAIAQGQILPLLMLTVIVGLLTTLMPVRYRLPLSRAFRGLAAAMLFVVRAILLGTPIGVFALIYPLALTTGLHVASLMGAYVLIACGVLLGMTALLYPVTAIAGRVTLRGFARAVAPAQLVAVSTRSSIASLPALVEAGRETLRLPATSTSFVLPLCVSLFKVNRTISGTIKLLFLAHVYGIPLSLSTIATFVLWVVIVSFGTAGVANGSSFSNLPAYLAAGIPIEGVVMVEATLVLQDVFNTLLNVTGDMSVAVLLSRAARTADGTVAEAEEYDPTPLVPAVR